MLWFRLAWRELVNNRRFSLYFIFNLVLGLSGLITLDSVRLNLSDTLQGQAKHLLTADVSVASRREITDDEELKLKGLLPKSSAVSRSTSLFSMVSTSGHSMLVNLQSIGDEHPFYGWIRLEDQRQFFSGTPRPLNQEKSIWIAPEVMLKLQVKKGDTIHVGALSFVVDGIIKEDTAASWFGASLAPTIYMGRQFIEQTDLLQKGSTSWNSIYIKLPASADPETIASTLSRAFPDTTLQITDYKKAGEDSGRLISYLTDYLGLAAIVALFFAILGMFFLFIDYFTERQKSQAILIALGVTPRQAVSLYIVQLFLLSLAAAGLSFGISALILQGLGQVLSPLSPIPIHFRLYPQTFGLGALVGIGFSFLMAFPILMNITGIKPALLFHDATTPRMKLMRPSILAALPLLFGFYGLAVWQAHSLRTGGIFIGVFFGSSLLLLLVGMGIIKLLHRLSPRASLAFRLSSRYFSYRSLNALSCFLALGLSFTLVNLIPQLRGTLMHEISAPDTGLIPSLFLFDIQEEQKEPLENYLNNQGIKIQNISPMVRGRLMDINDQAFTKGDTEAPPTTREDETERRFRNRGVNLSYRAQLDPSEKLVAGRWFQGEWDSHSPDLPEVTLEKRYAERLKIGLGDVLTFDVQTLPIKGKIVGIREVKWNSFQPNFFIQFQPGVLEDAPKTFLATLLPLADQRKWEIQTSLANQFPNVSIIDVSKLIDKILALIQQMSLALTIMAWLSLLAGLMVIYSIAAHQAHSRRWDHNLLKVLGAHQSLIIQETLWEFGLLAGGATIVGSILGTSMTAIFAQQVFSQKWQFDYRVPVFLGITVFLLCLGIALLGSRRSFHRKTSLNQS